MKIEIEIPDVGKEYEFSGIGSIVEIGQIYLDQKGIPTMAMYRMEMPSQTILYSRIGSKNPSDEPSYYASCRYAVGLLK